MNYLDKNGLIRVWEKIKNKIPKKTSELENDSGFIINEEEVFIGQEEDAPENTKLLVEPNQEGSTVYEDTLPINAIIEYDGDTVPDGYEEVEENEIIVSPTEPTGNNKKKVWMQKGKNLFDGKFENKTVSSGGIMLDHTARLKTTNLIKVEPNSYYTISISNSNVETYIFGYDADKNFIDAIVTDWNKTFPYTFQTGENIQYIYLVLRYSDNSDIGINDIKSLEIESGSEITEKRIYVKNSNDVYEEFMKKDEPLLETYKLLGSVNNEDKTITLSNDNLSNYKFLVVRSGYGKSYKSITMIPVALFKASGTSEKQCCQYVKTYNGYGITSISYVDDTSFKINGAVETTSIATDTFTYVYGVK